MEFGWQLPAIPLPPGPLRLVIEIGDKDNGIHTSRSFVYVIKTIMAATNITVPNDLTLSSILAVKMTPALLSNGEYVPFHNEKLFDGQLIDASGEPFYPQTSSETHRYTMRIKVGGIVVKTAEGEVVVSGDNSLVVEFESAVDENLDFGTGFSIDFQFETEASAAIGLVMEREVFVNVSSRLIGEGEALPTGETSYGSRISAEFKLKDEDSGRYLVSGHAYPVLVVLAKDDRRVLAEKKCKSEELQFVSHIDIGAGIPSGRVILAVMIRKSRDLVPVVTQAGSRFETELIVTGELEFSGKVREAGRFVVVDFGARLNNTKLGGTALACRILDSNGGVVSDVDLAQKKKGSRLSWESGNNKGTYTLELRRLSLPDDKPLFVKQIAIERSLSSLVQQLPVEGIVIALSFAFFVMSIWLRKGVESKR
jgi:hypothetical protein